MIDNYKIGNRIALLRRERALTGEKFAEALGVSPQAVSKWENGKCLPETALLPDVAKLLGTTIDSILMPQELVILEAKYTCGEANVTVTDALNRSVEGNRLFFRAESPINEQTADNSAVFILTVKYQTPSGTFYTYVPQGELLELNLKSDGIISKSDFQIIGAYYGTGRKYISVMDKIKHYEYFRNDEIHVNHETFPSSPDSDETEFLTLVYLNRDGIKVVSCVENGVLAYNTNYNELFVKDTSSCVLPNIMTLEWGENCTMPCTWAGAMYAALKYMGESYSYEQIMGMSGACYRIAFCEVWDWSALDALVAYSYDMPLYEAIGYTHEWACRLEKDERIKERRQIMSDIISGKPIVAINLRVAPEWGVITGYSDNGKTLYCRTYFDNEELNENKDYLKADNWPFLITHFGEKCEKPSDLVVLKNSLNALVGSFEAPPTGGYFQGKLGYEKWIEGLRNDAIWDEKCPRNDLNRRFDVHLSTLYQLVDARKCAAAYLREYRNFVNNDISRSLEEMAVDYLEIAERLDSFKDSLHARGVNIFSDSKDGAAKRNEQAELLMRTLDKETANVVKAKYILDNLVDH